MAFLIPDGGGAVQSVSQAIAKRGASRNMVTSASHGLLHGWGLFTKALSSFANWFTRPRPHIAAVASKAGTAAKVGGRVHKVAAVHAAWGVGSIASAVAPVAVLAIGSFLAFKGVKMVANHFRHHEPAPGATPADQQQAQVAGARR